MTSTNLLFIISDQHQRDVLGCYGNTIAQTPNLDALAAQGTRFRNAYTNCPICVPARASLATGRYVHQIGYWDNAFPYDGAVRGWGHSLREAGHQVDSIGKLHFKGPETDHGFSNEIDPLYVVDGVGDILGAIRDTPPRRNKRRGILNAGSGDSTYLQYDARNADNACQWLQDNGRQDKPWVLFVSFVCPHPPYIAPPAFFNRYPRENFPMPPQANIKEWPQHPALQTFRHFFHYDQPFSENEIRTLAAAYYGVCSYLDQEIGRVLDTLAAEGLDTQTTVIYTSDHGESLGARGMFGKFTMYEESAAVPFLMAGPDIPAGTVADTPVSLVDVYPTVLDVVGLPPDADEATLPGRSLRQIIQEPDPDRFVLSEYHALGNEHAAFMLRNGRYKYIHYVNHPPQLFDLDDDPQELNDLASSAAHQAQRQSLEVQLRMMLDPEAVDAQARADQQMQIAAFGGEAAVRARGAFDNSPVPGEEPDFRQH